jgi:hypothetical protein
MSSAESKDPEGVSFAMLIQGVLPVLCPRQPLGLRRIHSSNALFKERHFFKFPSVWE